MEQNTFTQADIKRYIENRLAHYYRHAFQIGLEMPEAYVTALLEFSRLAIWAKEFGFAQQLAAKARQLEELLPKKGTPAFHDFEELL